MRLGTLFEGVECMGILALLLAGLTDTPTALLLGFGGTGTLKGGRPMRLARGSLGFPELTCPGAPDGG